MSECGDYVVEFIFLMARFVEVTKTELDQLKDDAIPVATKKKEIWAMSLFRQ